MNSILTSIKKLLGISEEYEHFDADIIMHINSVFTILQQLGVGPQNGFVIHDKSTEWSDYATDPVDLELVKSYMALRVRQLFDPPVSSSAMDAMKRQIDEFEWRLNVASDPADTFVDE